MKFLKICDLIIEICIILIIALPLTPFYCFMYDCWGLGTLLLFETLMDIALLFWFLKFLIYGRENNIGPRIILPPLIFLLSLIIATFLAGLSVYNFFGGYRQMGLITWIYLFLFFLILVLEIDNRKRLRRILIVILVVSAPMVIYGVIQFLGIEFLGSGLHLGFASAPFTQRVVSTIGQPNFFASWLLMVIPSVIFSFFCFRNFYSKFFILLLIFFLIVGLTLTFSRGGWIGFMAGLIFFIFAWLALNKKFKQVIILGLFLMIFIAIYIYINFREPPKILSSSLPLNRIESLIFLKKSVTGYTRLNTWRAVIDLIQKRPIFGYGLEALGVLAPKYYQPSWAVYEAINSYPDRAHNDILDTLLNAGIVGLAAYLFLIISVFYYGLKSLKQNHQSTQSPKYPITLALLTGLFAYLISLQFSFHDIKTVIYFWLYLALILGVKQWSPKEGLADSQISTIKKRAPTEISAKKIILMSLAAMTVVFIFWFFSLRIFLGQWFFEKALLSFRQRNVAYGLQYYAKALSLRPEEPSYREILARFLSDKVVAGSVGIGKKDQLKILDVAIESINETPVKRRPITIQSYRAQMYLLKARITKETKDFEMANQIFDDLSKFSPRLAATYNKWCELKINEEKWEEALEKCQKVLSLYPDLKHPDLAEIHRQQIIAEMIQVYDKLGQIYFQKKDYDKALESYWQILHLSPFQYHIYKKIADVYYLRKDLDTAIKYNLHGHTLNPNDYNWPWSIALLYYEKGDFKMAKEYSQQAATLVPENRMIKSFLDNLNPK